MISQRNHRSREKRFDKTAHKQRGQHSEATLTDDHTLLLLHQHRERRARSAGRSWIARLFRRR